MKLEEVKSSRIKQMGYDADTQTARFKFPNGTICEYPDVDQKDYNDVRKAVSIGKAFGEFIKKYPDFAKLSEHSTTPKDGEKEKRVGHLVESAKVESANPIKDVDAGRCPGCGEPAKGFDPPKDNPMYDELHK